MEEDTIPKRKRIAAILFSIFFILTFASYYLYIVNMIVFRWFNYIPALLSCITVVSGIVMAYKKRRVPAQIFASFALQVILIVSIFIIGYIINALNPREWQKEYVSPSGQTTVIVEYDFVSVPSIYIKKNWLIMERVYLILVPATMRMSAIVLSGYPKNISNCLIALVAYGLWTYNDISISANHNTSRIGF